MNWSASHNYYQKPIAPHYGVRWQANRDAAVESRGEVVSTKAPPPVRSSKKLLLQHSGPEGVSSSLYVFAACSASSATLNCERPLDGSAGRAATGEGLCKQEFL